MKKPRLKHLSVLYGAQNMTLCNDKDYKISHDHIYAIAASKRISKRGSVLKVRGGCYNYQSYYIALTITEVTELGYKNISSKSIMANL